MRERIFTIIEKSKAGDKISHLYDCYIIAIAAASVIPLMFRQMNPYLQILETVTVYLLFLDYILRWMTHDYRRKKPGSASFVIYPFTGYAIMDILGILPSIGLLPQSFMVLRLLRLTKIIHYSKSCQRIARVFHKQKKILISVLSIAMAYIIISALIMFVHEPPDNFESFFDALYWATTALTTVGYGDVYPHTDIGKFISMLSSIFGVAVIAMPAGIITAGFMDELYQEIDEKKNGGKGGEDEDE